MISNILLFHVQHKQRQGYHTETCGNEHVGAAALVQTVGGNWLDAGASIGAQLWKSGPSMHY